MMSHAGLWPLGRVALALALGCLLSRSAEAQVYRLAELNIDQIRMLDRQRTVILLPGGVLEEHGPYLPSFTDGYRERTPDRGSRGRNREAARVGGGRISDHPAGIGWGEQDRWEVCLSRVVSDPHRHAAGGIHGSCD